VWHVASPWIADDVRSDVDQLILDLGLSARDPTGRDLEAIRRHVGAAGFDPLATFPADRRVVGLRRANGQIIQRGDAIPTAELHYLRHVVEQQEWPTGTTQAQYEASLRDLAVTLRVGILLSERPPFGWHVAIVGRTGSMRGPGGRDRVVVEYRVATGSWATGYQPREGSRFAISRLRRRWLRLPT
jgi:hypothetical protein